MAGLIESASLFRLAQEKAKDMRIYFDPYIEIEDKSPEASSVSWSSPPSCSCIS